MSAVEGLLRRADRLFRIIQVLRRSQRPTTAIAIAGELETSPRTIYRDIAQLMADRVPIRGEAGVGYILEDGFDMPPLMLTPDEIDAAILGAHWVMGRGDAALARAPPTFSPRSASCFPSICGKLLLEPDLTARSYRARPADSIDMGRVRAAIRSQTKIALVYSDERADGPAHGLADRRQLLGRGAGHHRLVRAAQRLPSFSRRPRRCRGLPGATLRHAAHQVESGLEEADAGILYPNGRVAPEGGCGAAGGIGPQ